MGLSATSWPLLQRLCQRNHVDCFALAKGAASTINNLPEDLLVGNPAEIIGKFWKPKGILIFVGSIGLVTRLVAPFVKSKEEDPAVLVLDANALNVVPLLGGHLAGAEDLAFQLAADLGGSAVLTSDAFVSSRLAFDSFGEAWGWVRGGDVSAWKTLMISQSLGEKLVLTQKSGSRMWQTLGTVKESLDKEDLSNSSSLKELVIGPQSYGECRWHPPSLWVGIGCERNTSLSLVKRALKHAFLSADLALEAVAGLATIDIKFDETALVYLSQENGWPIRFYSAKELSQVKVPNPSKLVAAEIGTESVAEAAAFLAAQNPVNLREEKKVYLSKGKDEIG